MAANTVSSGVFCVPPPCGRVRCSGISGLVISHKPSGAVQLHVPRLIPEQRPPHHVGHGLSRSRAPVVRPQNLGPDYASCLADQCRPVRARARCPGNADEPKEQRPRQRYVQVPAGLHLKASASQVECPHNGLRGRGFGFADVSHDFGSPSRRYACGSPNSRGRTSGGTSIDGVRADHLQDLEGTRKMLNTPGQGANRGRFGRTVQHLVDVPGSSQTLADVPVLRHTLGPRPARTRGPTAEGGLSNLTDEELLPAWDQVLEEFATALVRLHIACGTPPRSALAKQVDKGDRCRLPASTLSEVFNGKKISGIDFTMSGSEEAGNSPVALPAGPGDEEERPWLVGAKDGGRPAPGLPPSGSLRLLSRSVRWLREEVGRGGARWRRCGCWCGFRSCRCRSGRLRRRWRRCAGRTARS